MHQSGTSQHTVNVHELCTKSLPAHADSEYVSYHVGVDRKRAEFISNRQTN